MRWKKTGQRIKINVIIVFGFLLSSAVLLKYGWEQNMFGGFANNWSTPTGDVARMDLKRYAQWYLSLDVDFERIPTKSKALKSLFYVLDAIKMPAPTIMLANGKISGQWLYY